MTLQDGRFTSSSAGDDRLRLDLDLDGSVKTGPY